VNIVIEWIWPYMFLLLPIPWLISRFSPKHEFDSTAIRAPFFNEWKSLNSLYPSKTRSSQWRSIIFLWLAWICLVIASARPTWIGEPIELPNNGRDLMLAVDISGSMNTEDMPLSNGITRRVDAVKKLGAEFISRRSGDRLGLILFGSRAYLQSPLSFDVSTVSRFLSEAQIGFAGQETAIGDAIGLAVKRLKERPVASRILILLTDGRDTASSVKPLEAAQLAAELGIRIHTIGIGADKLTLPGLFGSSFGSRQINPSMELDEKTLETIARQTGGRYFRARDPQQLSQIYLLLDELEPIEQASSIYRPRQSLGHLFLAMTMIFSFFLVLFKMKPVILSSRKRAFSKVTSS